MHCSRVEDGVEAFVELGTLIVEGRLPAEGTPRGYSEGPHCHSSTTTPNPHQCDPSDFLCMRAERLRKHMSLLCNNAVPMCVEVLLCPSCQCGTERARSPEVANIPSSPDFLLEQWTVSVVHISGEPCSMTVRGLFQAVRSQLHFSQLSAWWSSNKGSRPSNVCYRITMPGEAFASQFSRPPLQHSFPPAAVGPNTQLKVSVRTLPRCESLPVVKCAACTPETNVRKRSIGLEQPLLGESLLDPPGPASSRAHAGLCKWHTGSPPSPPRRRASRQLMARRCDTHQPPNIVRHILPVQVPLPIPLPGPVDDRMQTDCNQHGKHACPCEDDAGPDSEELRSQRQRQSEAQTNKINLDLSKKEMEEVLTVLRVHDGTGDPGTIVPPADKADILLSAILRTSQTPSFKRKHPSSLSTPSTTSSPDAKSNQVRKHPSPIKLLPPDKGKHHKKDTSSPFDDPKTPNKTLEPKSDLCKCDNTISSQTNNIKSNNPCSDDRPTQSKQHTSDILSIVDRFRTKECDKKPNATKNQYVNEYFVEEFNNLDLNKRAEPGGSTGRDVPTALDKAKFRRSLDSAASMVFHWRTGLPLTSSPAPLRRSSQRFDFDSTITSVSAIRSALFDANGGEDAESESSSKSPCSPQIDIHMKGEPWTVHYQSPGSALLGSFEESVLNGRLEPVSTVHGFTADLGASGSFCPPHLVLPVTVFFYTLGDNDKVSSPYLAHINLSKKGYVVPRVGTIQLTLLNPLGTVIKMFVVMYDLSDMPTSSHTFLRQRTLYMPAGTEEPLDNTQKYLRYLIHLRFATSKSGRLLLHTDIRMIIFRKSDLDTATGHGVDLAYELRSFTYGPTNPKFSPRK